MRLNYVLIKIPTHILSVSQLLLTSDYCFFNFLPHFPFIIFTQPHSITSHSSPFSPLLYHVNLSFISFLFSLFVIMHLFLFSFSIFSLLFIIYYLFLLLFHFLFSVYSSSVNGSRSPSISVHKLGSGNDTYVLSPDKKGARKISVCLINYFYN